MTIMEAMEQRHSVRQFENKPLDEETISRLNTEIAAINQESGLHIQLFTEEPGAFEGNKPGYGQFAGCRNYFAMVGKKGMDETVGYFGERLVLFAQTLGLNTCWVALTYKKGRVAVDAAQYEKLYIVVALGYGKTQGAAHRIKAESDVSDIAADAPEWYKSGIRAALLAPTAMNQQKFKFSRSGNQVSTRPGLGFYTKIDLGIAKYHFEIGAGKENFKWS